MRTNQKKSPSSDAAPAGQDSYRQALEQALRKLKTKDRFEAEIRGSLAEFPAPVVDRVIAFLKGRRIIDDSKSIVNLVERHSGKRAISLERLRAELIERGAPEETIGAALADIGGDERRRMLEALAGKFSPAGGSRAKAARFLWSRGFAEDDIEVVLDRFFQS